MTPSETLDLALTPKRLSATRLIRGPELTSVPVPFVPDAHAAAAEVLSRGPSRLAGVFRSELLTENPWSSRLDA